MKVFEINEGDAVFRACYHSSPKSYMGTCILVPSGKTNKYDEVTPENTFYNQLIAKLINSGIEVIQLDMPHRNKLDVPASKEHIASRTRRIRLLFQEPSLAIKLKKVCLFGLSLGSQSILQLISDFSESKVVEGIIIFGCVVEAPVVVMSDLKVIHLVYGSHDYIAYISNDKSEFEVIPPSQYAELSAKNFVLRKWQQIHTHILEDFGHLPLPIPNKNTSAIPIILNIIHSIFSLT